MKTLALSCLLLAAAASVPFAMPAGAQQFQIQTKTADLQNAENVPATRDATKEAKQVRVLSALEVKRTFDLAASERGRQAIEISCAPGDSQWCTDDFVTACDDHDGGMSTNPDGSVTCSLPQHE